MNTKTLDINYDIIFFRYIYIITNKTICNILINDYN